VPIKRYELLTRRNEMPEKRSKVPNMQTLRPNRQEIDETLESLARDGLIEIAARGDGATGMVGMRSCGEARSFAQ
jgi:hypothetical protein